MLARGFGHPNSKFPPHPFRFSFIFSRNSIKNTFAVMRLKNRRNGPKKKIMGTVAFRKLNIKNKSTFFLPSLSLSSFSLAQNLLFKLNFRQGLFTESGMYGEEVKHELQLFIVKIPLLNTLRSQVT